MIINLRSREVILSLQLSPQDIADCFTLIEIEAQIASILVDINNASASKSDAFDDQSARQRVERQNITELNNSLSVWIKAKNIKTGADSATAELIAANYTGIHR